MLDRAFDLASLRAAYASGVSPTEVIEEVYRRVRCLGDPGVFIHLVPKELAIAEAAALPPFGQAADMPLWGIPFAIKDNIDLAGSPTTAACPAFRYDPSEDAHCVARLRRAGAIAIGKTNLDQFATGLVGVRSPYPIPRNAIDPEIVPGGSSSGSAVAVARGLVSFALGTDTAGSGRVPAALNNIVGLKPTLGVISSRGMVPACRTLDTVSVFALGVDDAFTVLSAAAGFDPADAYSRRIPVRRLVPIQAGLRIGVPNQATRRFFGDAVQAASFDDTLGRLAALGAEIVDLDFRPLYAVAELLYDGPWVAERYAAVEPLLHASPDVLHPVTRAVIERATEHTAADAFRGIYRLAELRRAAEILTDGIDMLCVPTIPGFVTVAETEADPIGPNSRLGTYTNFVNLLDMCGLAVPTAARSDGRPGNVTLLARAGRDHLVASLSRHLHAQADVTCGATGWSVPPLPEDEPTGPSADEIAIAVVGAHISGLPLNKDLVSRGGRFLRRTRTAPCYRLYALPGGPPHKPGLVRNEQGAAIEVEVWALPETSLGDFMRTMPGPLGIGTLTLADGGTVKGFVCEAIAALDATDITVHGGWRSYLLADARTT